MGADAWLTGRVCRVFVDEEGEWLTVVYRHTSGLIVSKETMRENVDIRPVPTNTSPISSINLDDDDLGMDELDEIAMQFDAASENTSPPQTTETMMAYIKSEISSAFPGMNMSRILGSTDESKNSMMASFASTMDETEETEDVEEEEEEEDIEEEEEEEEVVEEEEEEVVEEEEEEVV